LGHEWPTAGWAGVAPHKREKKRKKNKTSKSRTKKQKRLFDEITETLRQARVLAAKTALPKSSRKAENYPTNSSSEGILTFPSSGHLSSTNLASASISYD
jgi:hypothetical protein